MTCRAMLPQEEKKSILQEEDMERAFEEHIREMFCSGYRLDD